MDSVSEVPAERRAEELALENSANPPAECRRRGHLVRAAFRVKGRTAPHAQRSDEWFASRAGRITGSVFGAVLGHSGRQTAAAALRSVRRPPPGREECDLNAFNPAHAGQIMEPMAAEVYRVENYPGLDMVTSPPFLYWGGRSGASLDAYVPSCGVVVELKCPRRMPASYDKCHAMQLALQCAACGSDTGEVVYSDFSLEATSLSEVVFGELFEAASYDNALHTFPKCRARGDYVGVVAVSGRLVHHPSGDDYESFETLRQWASRHSDRTLLKWRIRGQRCHRFRIDAALVKYALDGATRELKGCK